MMEERHVLTEDELELAALWEADDSMNYFGCGQNIFNNK